MTRAGLINPFNGEGTACAMESARPAAECAVRAFARPAGPPREHMLHRCPPAVSEAMGGHFRMGGIFSKLIGNPAVLRMATKHGPPRRALMRFVLKTLANLYGGRDGDAMDRVISATTRLTPSAWESASGQMVA